MSHFYKKQTGSEQVIELLGCERVVDVTYDGGLVFRYIDQHGNFSSVLPTLYMDKDGKTVKGIRNYDTTCYLLSAYSSTNGEFRFEFNKTTGLVVNYDGTDVRIISVIFRAGILNSVCIDIAGVKHYFTTCDYLIPLYEKAMGMVFNFDNFLKLIPYYDIQLG